MKYKIRITYTECGIHTDAVLSFKSYQEAQDFYDKFDFDGFPDDVAIKRLYQ